MIYDLQTGRMLTRRPMVPRYDYRILGKVRSYFARNPTHSTMQCARKLKLHHATVKRYRTFINGSRATSVSIDTNVSRGQLCNTGSVCYTGLDTFML